MSFEHPQVFWLLWFDDQIFKTGDEGDGHFLYDTEEDAIESALQCCVENEGEHNVAVLRCEVTRVGFTEWHHPGFKTL